MARTWLGEVPSCYPSTLLLGPAWVLLNYCLANHIFGPCISYRVFESFEHNAAQE